MSGSERRTPGQALIERMEARTRRRPRIGMSPAFYTRLGLDDPWALEGVPYEAEPQNDGMTFLSAAPYYAMLRKLANARKRRERRQAKFFERRAGTTMRAAARAWPGEKKVSMSRIAALTVSDMQLPESAPAAAPAGEPGVIVAADPVRRRNEPTPSVANPWLNTPFTPARVVRAAAGATRPMERAGQRAAVAQRQAEDDRILGDLRPSTRARVVQVRDQIEFSEAAPVEVVRVVRRAKVARPVVRQVEEVALQPENGRSTDSRPTIVAQTRMQGAASRGLRPVALSSPAMAMAMADHMHAADVDRAAAGSLAVPERGEAMRPVAARRIPVVQRANARAQSGSPARAEALSASPVSSSRTASARPVAASLVVRATAARDGGAAGLSSTSSPSVQASSRRGRPMRASAVAALRLANAESFAGAAEPAAPSRMGGALVRGAAGVVSRPADRLETATASPTVTRSRVAASAPEAVLPEAVLPIATELASSRVVGGKRSESRDSSPPSVRAALRAEAPAPTGSTVPRPVAQRSRRAAFRAFAGPSVGGFAAESTVGESPRSSAPVLTKGSRYLPARVARAAALAARVPEMSPVTPVDVRTSVGEPSERPAPSAQLAARQARASEAPVSAAVAPVFQKRVQERRELLVAGGAKWAAARANPAPVSRSVVPRAMAALVVAQDPEMAAPARGAVGSPVSVRRRAVDSQPSSLPSTREGARRSPLSAPESVVLQPASSQGGVATSAGGAVEPRAALPGGVGAPAESSARKLRSPVVAAAARAESVQAQRIAAPVAQAAAPVRRSGPLSWARPERSRGLVASFAPPARRESAARPAQRISEVRASRLSGSASPILALTADSTRDTLNELVAAGLVSTSYSPSTPVRTPDGRFVSARVAAAMPGLAVLPAAEGPVAVGTQAPRGRSATFRTPEVRFLGASSATTPEGFFEGARSGHTRQTAWVGARSGVGESTAYKGAISARTPELDFFGAPTATTPEGQFVGARTARGNARASRRVAPAPTPMMFGEPVVAAATAPEAQVAPAGTPTLRSRRPLDSTLIDSATGVPMSDAAPVWAARAEGTPLVRSAQGLFDSLARATSAEQVVQVIAARAGGFEGAIPLTEPMRDVVQAIRNELASSPEIAQPITLATRAPEVRAPEATVLRGTRVSPVASSAISRSGAVRPVRSTAVSRGAGGADDRVSKLVRRLSDLIHLAETERRLAEAQSQVRMAEDTAAARAEGSAPLGQSAAGGSKLDVETFTREVLEVVNRELELRRERRTEDGDESNWW